MARGAKRARALVASAAGALVALLGVADAQTNSSRTVSQVERDRRAENARAQRLRTQAEAAQREVRALDTRLVDSGRRRAEAEAAALAAEQRLAALRLEIGAQSTRRSHAHDALESALITAAFAQRRVEPRAVRAGIFARAAASELNTAERRSSQALAEARQLENAIAEEQSILADAQAAIDAERAELVVLAAQRRAYQTQLVREVASAERRARLLATEARNLRELAERVQRASVRRPATGSATTGASVIPTAWLAPTSGQITRAYGERQGEAPATQGATVSTRSAAQVISPARGEVAYAGLFRSYGQVLILNLDGGYVLVLTGLESIRARVGETVNAGQPVGEMPVSDTTAPELYVEVRREGRPIDPGRWLNARGLAADRGVRAG